jgi:hypothetical protein
MDNFDYNIGYLYMTKDLYYSVFMTIVGSNRRPSFPVSRIRIVESSCPTHKYCVLD